MTLIPFGLLVAAYLAGSLPTSHLVGTRLFGVDLRREGSGNLGATNVFRVLGWKPALGVLFVDVFKGWLPVWLFPQLSGNAAWGWALAYGGAALLGHVFSVWVGFRGGKGIATSTGIFIALAPIATLTAFGVWCATLYLSRMVSLASILAALTLPLAIFLTSPDAESALLWFTAAMALFVTWAHRSNIRRIVRNEEGRVRFGRRKEQSLEELLP